MQDNEDVSAFCFCGQPAIWFLIEATVSRTRHVAALENFSSADLFEDLCDTCFARVVEETQRGLWVRIRG